MSIRWRRTAETVRIRTNRNRSRNNSSNKCSSSLAPARPLGSSSRARRSGSGDPSFEHGLGSGVIISPDGYIVTNNHVVAGAVNISVTMSNRDIYPAKLIGADPTTDLAVIKIDGHDFPSIPWGDSAKLEPGQLVLAFGNPYGFRFSVTRGIISALDRPNPDSDRRKPGEFIQTDAGHQPRQLRWCARRFSR
jgi:S1-C subfamily serine protease